MATPGRPPGLVLSDGRRHAACCRSGNGHDPGCRCYDLQVDAPMLLIEGQPEHSAPQWYSQSPIFLRLHEAGSGMNQPAQFWELVKHGLGSGTGAS